MRPDTFKILMIVEANAVLREFLPRSNHRFSVPAQCAEPAFRSLAPELYLEQFLCFKHCGRVAKDNTVRFQLHILQLLPGPKAPVPRQLYLPVGVNQFCRFTSLAWPRCWAALVR